MTPALLKQPVPEVSKLLVPASSHTPLVPLERLDAAAALDVLVTATMLCPVVSYLFDVAYPAAAEPPTDA